MCIYNNIDTDYLSVDAENQITMPTLDLNLPADNALSLVPSSPRPAGAYIYESISGSHMVHHFIAMDFVVLSMIILNCDFFCSAGTSSADQVKWFESRFHDLRRSALTQAKVQGITVEDFRQTLMTLPNAISKEHEQFLLSKYHLFEKAQTIERIFLHLNLYLSFIDFSLLEHIVEHFGSPGLQQKMKQYSRDMEMFRMKTKVADIIPHLSGRPEPPPQFVRLKIKLNFDPKTCTLEDLEQHRKNFGSEFLLSKFALFLMKIVEGSLVEVYLVPSDIVPALKDLVQKKSLTFFLNLEILKLSVNEECLYPCSTPKRGLASVSVLK